MSRTQRIEIGDTEVIALTDGGVDFGAEIFPNADEAQIDSLLKKAGAEAIQTNFNAFLVKSGGDTLLVDAGPRDLFGDTCGFLPDALAEAGTAPEDVTHLYFTHLHPDHMAGAITPEGTAVFPNATMFVAEDEARFWADNKFTDDTLVSWQRLAQSAISAYAGRTEFVGKNAEIIKGLTTLALPGHTPGHYGFHIDGGSRQFVHVGDIAHAQHLQFADPEISVVFDIDAEQARATRKRTLDMVATDELMMSGGHILSPKFGHLSRSGSGYVFEPE